MGNKQSSTYPKEVVRKKEVRPATKKHRLIQSVDQLNVEGSIPALKTSILLDVLHEINDLHDLFNFFRINGRLLSLIQHKHLDHEHLSKIICRFVLSNLFKMSLCNAVWLHLLTLPHIPSSRSKIILSTIALFSTIFLFSLNFYLMNMILTQTAVCCFLFCIFTVFFSSSH